MGRRKGKRKPPPDSRETVGRQSLLDKLAEQRGRGGNSIRFLPLLAWPERGLFVGAKDASLRQFTQGGFHARSGEAPGSHPIFVLQQLGNLAHRVCPCSTRKYANKRAIPQGCVLEHTLYVVRERTYLVEDCVFPVPRDKNFLWSLRYWGRVPESRLETEEE
ncbi:hypothetical protein AAU61_05125 [Desulfocarbo indianensis]|nr:hypothetical protein AAU61_05125 [Desulfocarbo indianensis]